MPLHLRSFPPESAGVVSGWARTALSGHRAGPPGPLRHPRVFLRVHPGNTAALRCYAAAGFDPVGPDQAAAWNTGQPFDYVWLIPAA
jgi:hypothetical protein